MDEGTALQAVLAGPVAVFDSAPFTELFCESPQWIEPAKTEASRAAFKLPVLDGKAEARALKKGMSLQVFLQSRSPTSTSAALPEPCP